MYFLHSSQIWTDFPTLVPGLLLVEGVTAGNQPGEHLKPLLEQARQHLVERQESELPSIQAWRRAFSQMGLKPTQYRSAAEALLRRFRKEGSLPNLHPLVDLCNAVSLAYALPIAVFDLNQIAEYIEVRYAHGNESYLAFTGEIEQPEPGEVIFVDSADQVHARRWTFRQSRQSTVTATTHQALIVTEGLHETAAHDITAVLDTLAHELDVLGFRASQRAILSAELPRWEQRYSQESL